MEEKDEFSDILLEKESENKASKFKKIALIVGVLVLIFLIVVIAMKAINKPDSKKDNSRLIIQPTAKETKKETSQTKDDPLFKQVPIIEEDSKKESFEEMVKKLKEKESKRAKEEAKAATDETTTVKNVPIVTKKAKIAPEPNPTIKPVPIKEVKKSKKVEKPKVTPKPKPKAKPAKEKGSKSVSSGTYIQVLASTKMSPDSGFIGKVKAKNYPYRLYKTSVKGTPYLKILVGPYKSQQEARGALANVRQDLNPKAFIFTIK